MYEEQSEDCPRCERKKARKEVWEEAEREREGKGEKKARVA